VRGNTGDTPKYGRWRVVAEQIPDPVLEIPEVAERLNMNPQTVRRYFRDGTIPGARRIGWKWIIPQSRLDAWLYGPSRNDH
jgi:excisionase family DNA binding protein